MQRTDTTDQCWGLMLLSQVIGRKGLDQKHVYRTMYLERFSQFIVLFVGFG